MSFTDANPAAPTSYLTVSSKASPAARLPRESGETETHVTEPPPAQLMVSPVTVELPRFETVKMALDVPAY